MSEISSIRAISECFIKPNHVLDESNKLFHLGSFELLQMCHCYNQKGFVFDKLPSEEDRGMHRFLERLKQSLSSTLVYFYPLAGQFVTQVDEDQHNSSIYIDCNKGRGAKFIHAALDNVTVNDILSPTYVPTTIIRSLFELGWISTNYDAHDQPMLVIQVTELKDGIFLGVSVNHVPLDGTTLLHFLSSWAQICKSTNGNSVISRLPICDRWFPKGCGPIIKIPYSTHPDEFISRYKMSSFNESIREVVLYLSSQSIEALKAKANEDCGLTDKISSVQALSAILWRCLARSRGLKSDETTTCLLIANGRSRLCPPLSQDYFGCFVVPIVKCVKVCELLGNNLGRVALLLHREVAEFDDARVCDAYSNWIENPFFPKAGEEDPNTIVVAGIPKSDVNDIDFGVGKVVATRSGGNKYDGRVTLRPGKEGKGSLSFEICLSPDAMTAFQQDTELMFFLS